MTTVNADAGRAFLTHHERCVREGVEYEAAIGLDTVAIRVTMTTR